ncbi:hypothetical protein AALP_AA1G226400 [Arabis alpina]|uniref:Uncharacterized protein n=1 Tax=Arabis alpina TaxID=50452 RepID=A0A087HPY8_ARAAL|nr:hypothetical protein AALP_AA1G226400 [Arabis alpina]
METSLRYSTNSTSLKIHTKEKLPVNSKTLFHLHGELDAGAPSYFCAMIIYFFHEASTSLKVGLHYDKREKLRCLVRGKNKFLVRTDELVTFNIKGKSKPWRAFKRKGVQKRGEKLAELANIWKFHKEQDLRLRVGYDMFDKVLKS